MAQLDTGLGWNAKAEWLMGSVGVIAEKRIVGGPDFPNQPIPKNLKTAADVVANGLKIFHFRQQYYGKTYYVAADGDDDILVAGRTFYTNPNGSIAWGLRYISPNQNAKINVAVVTTGSGAGTTMSTATITSYSSTYDLYFYDNIGSMYPVNNEYEYYTIPDYTDLSDAMPDVQVSNIPYYKLNNGYAVACVAKWYTIEGTLLVSPVLISTVPEYTVISTDGTTSASGMSTFDFLYQGARFYMSLVGGNDVDLYTTLEFANLLQFAAAAPSKVFSLLAAESFSNIQVSDAPDPYGDTAEEDGGEQTDPDDDPVEEETLPIPAVVGLGFSTIYVPTQTDLYNLAAYLWGGNLDLDNFLKLFANPMDSILGLSAVPLALSGTYEPIYLGGQLLQGITMPRYTGRTSVKVDMGTVNIKERWGAYLDYDPYTELAVYVPFVGIKNIKADDVMGKTVRLMYDIDILSGACIAYIRPEGGSVLYEWSGQCAVQIPITGANWDNIFSTAINTAATLGGALFAPASAPVLSGAVASAASQAIAAKPRIERSGAVNGITGFLGQLRPYIIRTIPEAYIPNDQNKFIGYPSYISVNLGQLSGYNEIASIHLENIPATGDELSELESILIGGVIF